MLKDLFLFIYFSWFCHFRSDSLKGLKHVGLELSFQESMIYSVLIGILIAILDLLFLRRVKDEDQERGDVVFNGVERVFAVLMVFQLAPWPLLMVLMM